jgi:hypothetical protein
MDFLTSYRILGLDPECDWDSARLRYQQLVSRHHPDRTGAEQDTATLAEINRAWRLLREHYQTHGQLPLQSPAPVALRPPSAPFRPPTPAAGRRRPWLILAVILLPLWVILMNLGREQSAPVSTFTDTPLPAPAPALVTPVLPETVTTTSTARLYPGDTMGHVIELLGPPDDTRGRRWYYGNSWIELTDGRVSDWHSSAEHPLPTDTLSRPALP